MEDNRESATPNATGGHFHGHHGQRWYSIDWSTPQKDPRDLRLVTAAFYTTVVGIPMFTLLGLVGNILTIIIHARKIRRTHAVSSMYLYFLFVAIMDSIYLLFNCIMVMQFYWPHVEALTKLVGCNWFMFIISLSQGMSSWSLVGISVERVILVYFPIRASRYQSLKASAAGLFVIFWMISAINFIHLGALELVPSDFGGYCQVRHDSLEYFYDFVYPWIDACAHAFVPCIIIVLANALLVTKVVTNLRKRRAANKDEKKSMSSTADKIEIFDNKSANDSGLDNTSVSFVTNNDIIEMTAPPFVTNNDIVETTAPPFVTNNDIVETTAPPFVTNNDIVEMTAPSSERNEDVVLSHVKVSFESSLKDADDREYPAMTNTSSVNVGKKKSVTSSVVLDRYSTRLTLVCMSVTFSFVILIAPASALNQILHASFTADALVQFDPFMGYFLFALQNLLRMLNHAMNFLCYCVTGTEFRADLRRLLSGN